MQDFFFRLHPPRATFPADITAEEGALVQEHVGYWEAELGRAVLTFGPVFAPQGVFGMAVARFADEAAAQAFAAGDPLIGKGQGFRYDIHPMQAARAAAASQ